MFTLIDTYISVDNTFCQYRPLFSNLEIKIISSVFASCMSFQIFLEFEKHWTKLTFEGIIR